MTRTTPWLVASLACISIGCSDDPAELRTSPVQALATVLETDQGLELELALVSLTSSPLQHVDGASQVEAASFELEPVGDGRFGGPFPVDFEPGEPYTFHFTLDDAVAGAANVFAGTFELSIAGNADQPGVHFEERPVAGRPLRLSWSPPTTAVIDVWREGEPTFSTLDWSNPAIDDDTWDLPVNGTGELDALPEPGNYEIRLCTVTVARRDDAPHDDAWGVIGQGLGSLSGAVAGRCTHVEFEVL
jgi:hypothetical protein